MLKSWQNTACLEQEAIHISNACTAYSFTAVAFPLLGDSPPDRT